MVKVKMECIPHEVLEFILQNDVLSFYDVCKFGSMCTDFWQLINSSDQIWKSKFKQRWPELMKNLMLQSHPITDWLDACKERCLIGRQTMKLVNNMSALHMKHQELSACDFKPFEELYSPSGHKLALLSIIDELKMCAYDENRNTNLTSKYYSEKVWRHLQQLYLAEKLNTFKNLPPEEQLLERVAVIVAQWFQPLEKITYTDIATQLDDLADEVRAQLRQEHGDKHPALLVPAELQAQWQIRNLTDNHYSPDVSQQVLQTISTVIFERLGFFANSNSYSDFFINMVLELRGAAIPITLGVVFESVTRRMGIKCEPVSFCYGNFLLRWRDNYRPDGPSEYFYIEVDNGGTLLDKDSYPQLVTQCNCCSMSPASATKVMECMCYYLVVILDDIEDTDDTDERSAIELSYLLNPTCRRSIQEYEYLYMQRKLDLAPLRRSLQENISKFDDLDMGMMRELDIYCDSWQHDRNVKDDSWKVKRREDDAPVKYAVGMVVRHLHDNYVGVVIGWDPQCARLDCKEVTYRNRHQPFYNVLTTEGKYLYSPEENLELENSSEQYTRIQHEMFGRFFDRFCGTHYKANSELESYYPEDMQVLRKRLGLP